MDPLGRLEVVPASFMEVELACELAPAPVGANQ